LLFRDDVRDAIQRTIPTQRGKRNECIFRLARALKGLPDLGDLGLQHFKPIVKHWHTKSRPHIGTPDFATTWGDFVHAWPRVHTPEGSDALREALAAAEAAPSPTWAAEYDAPCRLLASLCRELQRRAGPSPFFLSCGKAAECVGIDKGTASRWLAAFGADGALVVVEKGTKASGKATRFRYVADDLEAAGLAARV
jgi:hypothetical protein